MRNDRLDGTVDEHWRLPSERDEDRLLYASVFRRLTGVTQVMPPWETVLMHNRLTHSLKVGQIGKRAAQYLKVHTDDASIAAGGGLDPLVVHAAGLAHDVGHPPFGHIAEIELQRILSHDADRDRRLDDGFEGNAQAFRIITKTAARKQAGADSANGVHIGLGLTRATTAAILKYPWLKGSHPEVNAGYFSQKWGAYNAEAAELDWATELIPPANWRTLEAALMDWADDVTYAVHDIEDFYRVGLIPLHEVRNAIVGRDAGGPFEGFWSYAAFKISTKGEVEITDEQARRELEEIADHLPASAYRDSANDRFAVHQLGSHLMQRFQQRLSVDTEGRLNVHEDDGLLIEVLKQLTWYFVIDRPSLASLQKGQRRVINDLFQWLFEWVRESFQLRPGERAAQVHFRKARLPARLNDLVELCFTDAGSRDAYPTDEKKYSRGVVDFIASLTELQAYELHRRLGGVSEQPSGTGRFVI